MQIRMAVLIQAHHPPGSELFLQHRPQADIWEKARTTMTPSFTFLFLAVSDPSLTQEVF